LVNFERESIAAQLDAQQKYSVEAAEMERN
jgi:hypothetical protein